jgi:hypothetical protein
MRWSSATNFDKNLDREKRCNERIAAYHNKMFFKPGMLENCLLNYPLPIVIIWCYFEATIENFSLCKVKSTFGFFRTWLHLTLQNKTTQDMKLCKDVIGFSSENTPVLNESTHVRCKARRRNNDRGCALHAVDGAPLTALAIERLNTSTPLARSHFFATLSPKSATNTPLDIQYQSHYLALTFRLSGSNYQRINGPAPLGARLGPLQRPTNDGRRFCRVAAWFWS